MLTPDEEKYLAGIPENKKIFIQEFNPATKEVTNRIIARIQAEKPGIEVSNFGSTALEIAGQNDIDLNVLSSLDAYTDDLPILEKLFGQPKQKERLPMKWEFMEDGFEVEVYLSDKNSPTFQDHVRVYTAMKENPALESRRERTHPLRTTVSPLAIFSDRAWETEMASIERKFTGSPPPCQAYASTHL